MYKRSIVALSKQAGRTIVRDPRKRSKRLPLVVPKDPSHEVEPLQDPQPPPPQRLPLPFQYSQQDQQSIGSTMASYAVTGFGVALGVTLVRVVLGF